MPTWGEVLQEINQTRSPQGGPDVDAVRRKYLMAMAAHTGRAVISYSTKWTVPGEASPEVTTIVEEDRQGFMEVMNGLPGPDLDLILHSPGGSSEATEALVSYLRSKYSNIRVFIPQAAMSAATMLACSCDEIVMGSHSFLGPIDPQFVLQTPLGVRLVPAQAILDQFDLACRECQDPRKMGPWLPILQQFGPGLIVECQNALALGTALVQEWLQRYMFRSDPNAATKAQAIARFLSDHKYFKSHARHISRDDARRIEMRILNLEDDQVLRDLVLSCFHATTHTFNMTPAVKIIENNNGKTFLKLHFSAPMMVGQSQPPAIIRPGPQPPVAP